LKNEIQGKRALLSAYCQVLHRLHLFKEQYHQDKITKAFNDCFNTQDSYRIQSIDLQRPQFSFPSVHIVLPVLAARKFPEGSAKLIEEWTLLQNAEFNDALLNYSQNKEFRRMLDLNCKRTRVELRIVDIS
jgi:hypothetical protein